MSDLRFNFKETMRVKRGDLVTPVISPCELFGEDLYKTENNFNPGEIGTVLVDKPTKIHDPYSSTPTYIIKLLTPGGVGWVYLGYLKVIQ